MTNGGGAACAAPEGRAARSTERTAKGEPYPLLFPTSLKCREIERISTSRALRTTRNRSGFVHARAPPGPADVTSSAVSQLVLDSAKSHICVRTFAEGLLARLAHDLDIACADLSGTASRTADGASFSGTADIAVPLAGISVRGVSKGGAVDERALSSRDRAEIIAKMLAEVFHSDSSGVLRVHASLEGGSAHLRLTPPGRAVTEVKVAPTISSSERSISLAGTFDVSLAALGASPIKGPMGAFRVKDTVKISFNVVFNAEDASPVR